MDIQDAQRLLRQQVSISGQHLLLLEQANTVLAVRACSQACLLALELGLVTYVRALFLGQDIQRLSDCQDFPTAATGDYRQQEMLNLFRDRRSWLSQLARIFESMKTLAQAPSTKVNKAKAGELIATSVGENTNEHWSTLEPPQLSGYIDATKALLHHHATYDQEY